MWFSRAGYTGVDTTDSEDGHDTVELKADAFSSKRSNRMFTWQNIAGIAGWVVAFIFSLIIAMQDSRLTDQGDCFMQTSAYCMLQWLQIYCSIFVLMANCVDYFTAPLLDYIPHSFIHTKTNGTLDFPSVYRGTPSQELDEAWDSISICEPNPPLQLWNVLTMDSSSAGCRCERRAIPQIWFVARKCCPKRTTIWRGPLLTAWVLASVTLRG